jgi:hypothetical protein
MRIASPTKSSPSRSSVAKYVLLDDPMKTIMLQLNQNHLPPLINNEFLCTQTIDYLIQWSIHLKKSDRMIITSSLSLPIMQTYLQLDEKHQ